ncbi:hypothetical protein Tco_0514308 [Tanacetum coccineum]
MLVKIIPDEKELAVDAIPLATKPLFIVDYKIHKEEKTSYYKITRADGSSKMYKVFSQLLKSFNREDLETLWRLVKAKHGNTRPQEGYDRVFWGDLKVMFEPHVEDAMWRDLREGKVLTWKLFDSCGVHFVRVTTAESLQLLQGLRLLQDNADEKIIAIVVLPRLGGCYRSLGEYVGKARTESNRGLRG